MLQFAEVDWDYSASAFLERPKISLESVSRTAERTTQGGSPSPKSRFHRFKSLSTPSMQRARGTTFQMPYRLQSNLYTECNF